MSSDVAIAVPARVGRASPPRFCIFCAFCAGAVVAARDTLLSSAETGDWAADGMARAERAGSSAQAAAQASADKTTMTFFNLSKL